MDRIKFAASYASDYGIAPKSENEDDQAFIYRVVGTLREAGYLIEAHEVFSGKRWDDDNPNALTGIYGAVAQALQGRRYPGNQIDNDFAAGVVAQNPRDENDGMSVLLMMMLGK